MKDVVHQAITLNIESKSSIFHDSGLVKNVMHARTFMPTYKQILSLFKVPHKYINNFTSEIASKKKNHDDINGDQL